MATHKGGSMDSNDPPPPPQNKVTLTFIYQFFDIRICLYMSLLLHIHVHTRKCTPLVIITCFKLIFVCTCMCCVGIFIIFHHVGYSTTSNMSEHINCMHVPYRILNSQIDPLKMFTQVLYIFITLFNVQVHVPHMYILLL